MRNAFAIIFIIGIVVATPCATESTSWAAVESIQLSVDQMLSIAEKQHEIVRLFIKEGRYDRVLPEMRKILELNLPAEYEQLVAKSSSFIAHLLAENRQYALGYALLDETIARMRLSENIASLLKIKAYLYKSEGKVGLAIETLERSVEIERQQAQ